MRKPKRSGAGAKPSHLLDTSTTLWALGSPERLSSRARRLVDAGENVVSVASYWEVTPLAAPPMRHKDPFDRILIAQAIAEGLDFVTSDEPIADYAVRTIR